MTGTILLFSSHCNASNFNSFPSREENLDEVLHDMKDLEGDCMRMHGQHVSSSSSVGTLLLIFLQRQIFVSYSAVQCPHQY